MIAGVGGQGTVLASKLIAAAAMKKGFNVRTTETIGMAQRGGCVTSHIRIGDVIFSPLIPLGKADALIAFEPAEAVRQLPFLDKQGIMVVCDNAIKPIGSSWPAQAGEYKSSTMIDYLKNNVSKIVVIDGKRLTEHNAKTINVALLGAAAESKIFPFDSETLKQVLPDLLPERFIEMNTISYELGRSLYNEYSR
jgi:indolepyruvate ferredoxin oxidoreductase beta subunit